MGTKWAPKLLSGPIGPSNFQKRINEDPPLPPPTIGIDVRLFDHFILVTRRRLMQNSQIHKSQIWETKNKKLKLNQEIKHWSCPDPIPEAKIQTWTILGPCWVDDIRCPTAVDFTVKGKSTHCSLFATCAPVRTFEVNSGCYNDQMAMGDLPLELRLSVEHARGGYCSDWLPIQENGRCPHVRAVKLHGRFRPDPVTDRRRRPCKLRVSAWNF